MPTPVSCLVISKTAALLNQCITSLRQARTEWCEQDEILCSWNGTEAEEAQIVPQKGPCVASRPALRIDQREPYHFATNMNSLAQAASNELILLVNDDVILDPGSLDYGISRLLGDQNIALLGGLLRTTQARLSHAGILFSCSGVPYNRCHPELGGMLDLTSDEIQRSGPIPAVTGALMLLRRDTIIQTPMRQTFDHCGEDVAFCLDVVKKNKGWVHYDSKFSGIHNEKTTRQNTNDEADLQAVATLAQTELRVNHDLATLQSEWQCSEGQWLAGLALNQYIETDKRQQQINSLIDQHRRDRERLISEREQARQAIEAQAIDHRQQIEQFTSSTSWRITKPVRRLGEILQTFKQRLRR